jgi:phospholipid transport system substrate-binding protein
MSGDDEMRHANRLAFVCGLVAAALSLNAPSSSRAAGNAAPPPPPPTARAVMEKVTLQAIAILRDGTLSPDQKRQKAKQLAEDNVDFNVMARLSLGRPWRDITDAQRAQYVDAFKQHVAITYSHITDDYTDEDINIVADHQESDADWTVQTSIVGNKNGGQRKEEAKVDYRLRKQNDQWKVIDFTIDNISLIANFRSQFQEIMSKGGIDQLIKLLQDKNAANEK